MNKKLKKNDVNFYIRKHIDIDIGLIIYYKN